MRKIVFWVGIFAVLALASCVREMEQTEGTQLVFRAVWGEEPATRTVLQSDGTSVWWTPGEEINVFYGDRFSGKFTSTNTTNQALASFQGTLTVITGTAESGNEASSYWAVYPYDESNIFDGSNVTLTVPSTQAAAEGSFADKLFPAVATSSGLDLAFYNVCGGARFTVTHEGIQSVIFRSNGGEALVGRVKVGFDLDGHPEVREVFDGQSEVTVNAPSGGFVPGKYYFVVFLPQTLSKGLSMQFETSSQRASYVIENSITVNRSRFGKLDGKDKDLVFTSIPEVIDLGLSVMWASYNLGASAPEEYGDFYSWGEIYQPKDEYYWSAYEWCGGTETSLTKYNTTTDYGTVDNKVMLDYEDDVVQVLLGGSWHLPTFREFDELINNCTSVWTTENGVHGFRFTSKKQGYTDKSIFLPAAGIHNRSNYANAEICGYYWSSSLRQEKPCDARYLFFQSSGAELRNSYRYNGLTIRPVYLLTPVTDILFSASSLTLPKGSHHQLIATVQPENASRSELIWSSSDEAVAIVDSGGLVTGIAVGSAVITATASDGSGVSSSCTVTVGAPNPQAVDLGLSVMWATFNLGASAPEEYGDYYSWGEVEQKDNYLWSNYNWCNGTGTTLTKYNTNSSYGTVDNKMQLDSEDDVVCAEWGSGWRMPSSLEVDELINNCTSVWTTENGVYGYRLTSKKQGYTDKSIFLPAAGFHIDTSLKNAGTDGDYWSLSLDSGTPYNAQSLRFTSSKVYRYSNSRYYGFTIRPVSLSLIPVTGIHLSSSSLILSKGHSCQLIATVQPDNASKKELIWSSSNESVATVDANGVIIGLDIGTTIISATATDGSGVTASCTVTVEILTVPIPEEVDLGLSVKWASFNLGASDTESYGDYYAWGEVVPHYQAGHSRDNPCFIWRENMSGYNWASYGWCNGNSTMLTKYNTKSSNGAVDNKTTLDLEDDAAHVCLGGDWRMPTREEWIELLKNCKKAGNQFTSKRVGFTDKSVILPSGGFRYDNKLYSLIINPGGYYWSSSLNEEDPSRAVYYNYGTTLEPYDYRYAGLSIRPVKPNPNYVTVTKVTLNKKKLNLIVGQTETLVATLVPATASNKTITWTSSDTSVATVDSQGLITAVSKGTATIKATANCVSNIVVNCTVIVSNTCPEGAVDLGLTTSEGYKLYWATCNLEASSPQKSGKYYAWGVVSTYYYYSLDRVIWNEGKDSGYDWTSYKWCNGSKSSLTKYNTKSSFGTVDNKTTLEPRDDAAHHVLEGSWRIPTYEEWKDLINNCTVVWTTNNGVRGRRFTSKISGYTGNSIFLPAAGFWTGTRFSSDTDTEVIYGSYWSSSLSKTDPSCAYVFWFSEYMMNSAESNGERCIGNTIRPVSE